MDSKVSEKDMREVYFQAFGKEYDSANRKQAPLPLEIAYFVAINKLKREGKYTGGGEITDDIYFQSVNHFIYFCMNYPRNFLDAFGSLKNHLSNKFKNYYNKYGTYGVMIQFYAELDAENRRTLTDYSLKNYKGTPIDSDVSEIEYFNSVNHFIFFCFNFPPNFMDAFSSHLKVHLSSKWTNAYEKKGSVGAMIYFWSELDNENRRKLADWVRVNYTGTRLYEVGGALGDVAGMLPSPLPMSTIQAMADGGQLELFADGGGVGKKSDRNETQENNFGVSYKLGDKFILGKNFGNNKDVEVSITEIMPSGLFFKVDKSDKTFSIKTLHSKGSTYTSGEYLIPIKNQYSDGGGVDKFPPKGELTNKDNFLLKYEKKGSDYEFFVYKPITKEVSGYNQIKHVCTNKDCPQKMTYEQFINYLYVELYLDDNKYSDGGDVDDDSKFINFKKQLIKYSDFNEKTGDGFSSRYVGLKNKKGDKSNGEYLIEGNTITWVYIDEKGNEYISDEVPEFIIDLTGKKESFNKGYADGGGVDYYELQDLKNKESVLEKELHQISDNQSDGWRIDLALVRSELESVREEISKLENKYADGGGVKSDYYIFEGMDNLNGKPLYRVESTSESDNEYVGEWHTDKSDAEKELKSFYADGGEMDNISIAKSNAIDKIDFEYYAKQYAGDSWNKMSSSEKSELMSDIKENWFNDSEYAKGGIVVTKIKDIPNFKERLDEGRITYRGLGMGKLFDDFYKISGTTGTRIKVDGKEYFITDEEFDTFSRDENGKLRVKFNAPHRKFSDGGETIDLFEDYENIPANVQEVIDTYSNKFGEDFGEMDYDDMAEMQKDIEKLGYTFDSGLDNQPYGLRPIGVELNQLRGFEDFSKGGSTKVFKYGGEIEERVKEKLSRNFTLPFEVVVYVPSTQDADKTVSKEQFMGRITEVETYLAKLFGGFSSNPVDGGYNSDEKGLIKEDVFKVFSFASRDGFEPKMEELVIQIKKWCKVWGQEAIGLEFEGDLFYVEA
jgi:hypothetical protein